MTDSIKGAKLNLLHTRIGLRKLFMDAYTESKSVRLALGLSEEAAAEYLMIPVCKFKEWENGIDIDDSVKKVAIRTLAKYHRYKK